MPTCCAACAATSGSARSSTCRTGWSRSISRASSSNDATSRLLGVEGSELSAFRHRTSGRCPRRRGCRLSTLAAGETVWASSANPAAARASPPRRSCASCHARRRASRRAHHVSKATIWLRLREPRMREMRGDRIGMIFQEPMTSLNPTCALGADRRGAARFIAAWATAMREARGRRHAAQGRHRQRRAAARTNIRMSCRAACGSG